VLWTLRLNTDGMGVAGGGELPTRVLAFLVTTVGASAVSALPPLPGRRAARRAAM
jgi:hypothetical protein